MCKQRKGQMWLCTLDSKIIIQKILNRLERWAESIKMMSNIDGGKILLLGSPDLPHICGKLSPWGTSASSHAKLVTVVPGWICVRLVAAVSVQDLSIRIHSAVFQHAPHCCMYQEWGWLNSVLVSISFFFAPRKAHKFMPYCLRHRSKASMIKDAPVWWSHWKRPVGIFI